MSFSTAAVNELIANANTISVASILAASPHTYANFNESTGTMTESLNISSFYDRTDSSFGMNYIRPTRSSRVSACGFGQDTSGDGDAYLSMSPQNSNPDGLSTVGAVFYYTTSGPSAQNEVELTITIIGD